jgi:ABC-type amino acid transport substrate-binding protein
MITISANDIKNITGVSENWEGATDKNCKGIYWEIATEVYKLSDIKLTCKLVPYSRSIKLVQNNKADFWIGSYIDEEDFAYYPKIPIDADIVSVLYNRSHIGFKNINDLKNKKVAWVQGYDYDEYLNFKVNKKEIHTRASGIKMILLGRVDYLLDAMVDLKISLKKLTPKQRKRLVLKEIIKLKLYLGFNNTKKGRLLAKIWDTNIEKLHKNGKLLELYKKSNYNILYPYK